MSSNPAGLAQLEQAYIKKKCFNETQLKWLHENVKLGVKDDLRDLDKDQLTELFPRRGRKKKADKKGTRRAKKTAAASAAPTDYPINDTLLMYTLVWQTGLLIDAGVEEPIRGNQRSFWYQTVEPLYTNAGLLVLPKGPDFYGMPSILDAYDEELRLVKPVDLRVMAAAGEGGRHGTYILSLISSSLDDFVIAGIFSFRDPFAFQDTREQFHLIGKTPSIIYYTEKEGMWYLGQEFNHDPKAGISALASKGEIGYLTLEYFTAQLRGHKCRLLRVGAMCDYDPWGLEIAENFKAKLEMPVFGYPDGPLEVELTYLTSAKLFKPDAIAKKHRDLSGDQGNQEGRVQRWFEKTGGIDGKRWAMHLDNADKDRIRDTVRAWIVKAKREAKEHRRKGQKDDDEG